MTSHSKSARRLSSIFSLKSSDSDSASVQSAGRHGSLAEETGGRSSRPMPGHTPVHSFSHPLPGGPPSSGPFLAPKPWGMHHSPQQIPVETMADLTLEPPPPIMVELPGSRPQTPTGMGRPASHTASPSGMERPGTPTAISKRRSWIPSRSRNISRDMGTNTRSQNKAWVRVGENELVYDLSPLELAQKAWDVWQETGDTFVYLYPKASRKAALFKVESSIIASSAPLTFLAHGGIYSFRGRTSGDHDRITRDLVLPVPPVSPPITPVIEPFDQVSPTESSQGVSKKSSSQGSRTTFDSLDGPVKDAHLYFPTSLSADDYAGPHEPCLSEEDLDQLISIRNLFAFLLRQPLVMTPRQPTNFDVFLQIAGLLAEHQFTNLDGSTFGEVAESSFAYYIAELNLADVRHSREKTIEGVILGERMRNADLYNESFVHAVGKWADVAALNSPKYGLISRTTRSRIERAHFDLDRRLATLRTCLHDFEFPSLFSGIANSTALPEGKSVNFKQWKNSFLALRRHVLSYYKTTYGSWPPKARSKKNDFEESGFNRLLLRDLTLDFSTLYDLLVDRSSLTTRGIDADDASDASALRKVLSEFDHSTPPVKPPMPFDTPLLPSLAAMTSDTYPLAGPDRLKAFKKLNSSRVRDAAPLDALLNRASNLDTLANPSPFLQAFRTFERKSAINVPVHEVADQRLGYWLFLYVVLQNLPLLVVDAPCVHFSQGVEYFLCEPPRGGLPWAREQPRASWYGVAGGAAVVSLPSEVVDYGVEGVYRRSHAWEQAARWMGPGVTVQVDEPDSPVLSQRRRRSSGLEHLPVPQGAISSQRQRSGDKSNPGMSFQDILGKVEEKEGKKGKRERSKIRI
ncbi:MAG: hypothetical protein M1814_000364 [Vezdaea aestivalis]|nr:MAG: hypothetical protein M1814_000364 [Vezdaea aestivalis]